MKLIKHSVRIFSLVIVSLPGLSDVDNDGDMDIIGYNSFPDARFVFYQLFHGNV
ncbi:MAG: hypothetical protein IPN88_04510 [Bacteroidetes bacterium]|nr:hypothetical protein [Bacteroidota bacterium]